MRESVFDPPDYSPQIKDGVLPPDLYGAHAAAVWLAHAADTIRSLTVVPQGHTVAAQVFILIEHLRNRIVTDELIVADAAEEIAAARETAEPATCGGLSAASYHELAVLDAKRVLQAIYDTADEQVALLHCVNPLYTFPMEKIRERWDAARFAIVDLPALDDGFRAKLKLEIIRTAERRAQRHSLDAAPLDTAKPLAGDPPDNSTKRTTKNKLKEPSADALTCYRLSFATGWKQNDLAKRLSRELGKPVDQPKVSRWLKEVKAYLKAGNVLPDLTEIIGPAPKVRSMDPAKIDRGDGRKKATRRPSGAASGDDELHRLIEEQQADDGVDAIDDDE